MIKKLSIAAAFVLCAGTALAQSPAPTPNPARFAQNKKALIETRAKTDQCVGSANDGRALMGCLRAERKAMKAAAHGGRHGGGMNKQGATAPEVQPKP